MSTRTKEKWSAAFVGGGLVLAVFALWLASRHVLDNWNEPLITAPGVTHNHGDWQPSADPNYYMQAAYALGVIAGLALLAGLVIATVAYAKKLRAERLSRFTLAMLAGVATIPVSIGLGTVLYRGPNDDISGYILLVGAGIGTVVAIVGSVGVLARPSTSRVDGLVGTAPSSV